LSVNALDSLVRSLRHEFAGARRGGHITELLASYAKVHTDWRDFALFCPDTYARNLVAREADFELMILCWQAGQQSSIHNHEGQDCWMAVLEGDIEEVRYPMPEEGFRGALEPQGSWAFEAGQVAYIRDEMGLHLVRPMLGSHRRGITLHLYSSPYDECNCYCPETGRVTRARLEHYSVRGQRVSQGSGT